MPDKSYYEAYDERYRISHEAGVRWMGDTPSPIVLETIRKYSVEREQPMLELGCGEGRDAEPLLKNGYDLLATDVSPEAIRYCRAMLPAYAGRFQKLDCVKGTLKGRFSFIYAIAVLHMLVPDEDRRAFYRFIAEHLTEKGIALVCSMGDGQTERQSDIREAFLLQEREGPGGKLLLPSTSCRMVSMERFRSEIRESGLTILEDGICACEPQFDRMIYAVIKQ